MAIIYTPTGKAREYSPLALNVYNGCDHGCSYCYTQGIKRSNVCHKTAINRQDLLQKLRKELAAGTPQQQILLCFMCDPYCCHDTEAQQTRHVLQELDRNGCLVAVLSKGGKRCLRDVDIFKHMGRRFKYGATLTLLDGGQSSSIEPGAASPQERLDILKFLHGQDIKTFVSMEPVIDPAQSLELMRQSLAFVDQYKIGKLNHYENRFERINWREFFLDAVKIMRDNNKEFYIKHDLRAFDTDKILLPYECDHDFMALKFESRDNTSSHDAA